MSLWNGIKNFHWQWRVKNFRIPGYLSVRAPSPTPLSSLYLHSVKSRTILSFQLLYARSIGPEAPFWIFAHSTPLEKLAPTVVMHATHASAKCLSRGGYHSEVFCHQWAINNEETWKTKSEILSKKIQNSAILLYFWIWWLWAALEGKTLRAPVWSPVSPSPPLYPPLFIELWCLLENTMWLN